VAKSKVWSRRFADSVSDSSSRLRWFYILLVVIFNLGLIHLAFSGVPGALAGNCMELF